MLRPLPIPSDLKLKILIQSKGTRRVVTDSAESQPTPQRGPGQRWADELVAFLDAEREGDAAFVYCHLGC